MHPRLHKNLLLQPLSKVRQSNQQIAQQIIDNAGPLHNNDVRLDKDPEEVLLIVKLQPFHELQGN
jgi:hypothetical protein